MKKLLLQEQIFALSITSKHTHNCKLLKCQQEKGAEYNRQEKIHGVSERERDRDREK